MRKLFLTLPLLALPAMLWGQAGDTETPNAIFRREAAEHSQVMHTLHVVTDRYGPRLTGSPNHEAAAAWAVKRYRPGWSGPSVTRMVIERLPPEGLRV